MLNRLSSVNLRRADRTNWRFDCCLWPGNDGGHGKLPRRAGRLPPLWPKSYGPVRRRNTPPTSSNGSVPTAVSFHFGLRKQKTRNDLDCPVAKPGQRLVQLEPSRLCRLTDRATAQPGKQVVDGLDQIPGPIAILDVCRMDYETN
jgi:hypothetical protein